MFGVYCVNDGMHNHFLYSELKGGKVANEVVSILHHTPGLMNFMIPHMKEEEQKTSEEDLRTQNLCLTIWCDSCAGQNKNSYVIGFYYSSWIAVY